MLIHRGAVAVIILALLTAWPHVVSATTEADAVTIAENFVISVIENAGDWNGAAHAYVQECSELHSEGRLIAYNVSISPTGCVVVPLDRRLSPVKFFSTSRRLDEKAVCGRSSLVREIMDLTIRAMEEKSSIQAAPGSPQVSTALSEQWNWLLGEGPSPGTFSQVGPLLETTWLQKCPYNQLCPAGDDTCSICPSGGAPCSLTCVGCVAVAGAQIMKYWEHPACGTGSNGYMWNGDQTCGGDAGGGWLSANFCDSYDWANMLDTYDGEYTETERDAVAELCYEVGVAFSTDYGVCRSNAYLVAAQNAYVDYFNYSDSITKVTRDTISSSQAWFDRIKVELDASPGRPIHYTVTNHSLVCDGYMENGANYVHMNYALVSGQDGWYAIDSLYCPWIGCNPLYEKMLCGIEPLQSPIDPDSSTIEVELDKLFVCPCGSPDTTSSSVDTLGITLTIKDAEGDCLESECCLVELILSPHSAEDTVHACGGDTAYFEGITDGDGKLYLALWGMGGCGQADLTASVNGVTLSGTATVLVNSPDMDGDGVVGLSDFGRFTVMYNTENWCGNFNHDLKDSVDLVDFGKFSAHYAHQCSSSSESRGGMRSRSFSIWSDTGGREMPREQQDASTTSSQVEVSLRDPDSASGRLACFEIGLQFDGAPSACTWRGGTFGLIQRLTGSEPEGREALVWVVSDIEGDFDGTLGTLEFASDRSAPMAPPRIVSARGMHEGGGITDLTGQVRIHSIGTEPEVGDRQTVTLETGPSPSAGSVGVRFGAGVSAGDRLALDLYDVRGRLVKRVYVGPNDGELHSAELRLGDLEGLVSGSGVYFLRLSVDGRVLAARKVVLVR